MVGVELRLCCRSSSNTVGGGGSGGGDAWGRALLVVSG